MRHTFECPLRWADMDLLGHVNNVTYLDYVTEARTAMLAGHPVSGARVLRHQVEFAKPLVFRRAPVLVDSWVTAVEDDAVHLEQHVRDDSGTYLRASTVLGHRPGEAEREVLDGFSESPGEWRDPIARPRPADVPPVPLHVRLADLDQRGDVTPGRHLELFQEARIRFLMDLHTRGEKWSHHVVARTDVELLAPVRHRASSYDVRSWIGHLGERSFSIAAELADGERVLARATSVMVAFDMETQRPTTMTPEQRARLEREVD